MTKLIDKLDIYNLSPAAGKSCFWAFDPSDFSEMDGYINNPAFQNEGTRSLLDIANKALVYFTRASSAYEQETKQRYSYVSTDEQAKADKHKKVIVPAFSAVPFQAFKRKRKDFDEAVIFCLKNIRRILAKEEWKNLCQTGERTGSNDTSLLEGVFQSDELEAPIFFKATKGNVYKRPHLLAVFALRKIDRCFLAIQNNLTADMAALLVDASKALNISEEYYRIEIRKLNAQKQKSEQKATIASQRHNKLEPVKQKIIKAFSEKEEWPSKTKAAQEFYKSLNPDEKKKFVSPGGAVKTISRWLTEADPDGKKTLYGKNKKLPLAG